MGAFDAREFLTEQYKAEVLLHPGFGCRSADNAARRSVRGF